MGKQLPTIWNDGNFLPIKMVTRAKKFPIYDYYITDLIQIMIMINFPRYLI